MGGTPRVPKAFRSRRSEQSLSRFLISSIQLLIKRHCEPRGDQRAVQLIAAAGVIVSPTEPIRDMTLQSELFSGI
jgi:hypothetical protein